jgi:hypothetical protein
MPLGAQQDVQAAIAEPALLGRQLFQAASQILVSWSLNDSERYFDRR